MASYLQALQRRAEWTQVMNELAWCLATSTDQSLRDGAEAVRLAERASALVEHKHPVIRDTLGAAYAEAGEFPRGNCVALGRRDCRSTVRLQRDDAVDYDVRHAGGDVVIDEVAATQAIEEQIAESLGLKTIPARLCGRVQRSGFRL